VSCWKRRSKLVNRSERICGYKTSDFATSSTNKRSKQRSSKRSSETVVVAAVQRP
jgi:hypothetical protein